MDKQKVKEFFDDRAAKWDDELIIDERVVGVILDEAGICQEYCDANDRGDVTEKSVLDVACGTGVMIDFYKARGIKDITAIDISEKMIEIAKGKFPDVKFICGDVEAVELGRKFDYIVVYNAFPHFPNGVELVERLTGLLNVGGTLTIAHGMGRRKIDNHHRGSAAHVSNGLISTTALAKIFKYFKLEVTCEISTERMYQVTGRKRNA